MEVKFSGEFSIDEGKQLAVCAIGAGSIDLLTDVQREALISDLDQRARQLLETDQVEYRIEEADTPLGMVYLFYFRTKQENSDEPDK